MNISNELRQQLVRFSNTRSAHLNEQLKSELSIHFASLGMGKLNKSCNTCVRIAMYKVHDNMDKVRPVIQQENSHMKEQPPKLHFVGVKQHTFAELKTQAKERGMTITRTTKRNEVEEFLKS